MTPFSISPITSGRAHLAIAASEYIRKKPVSYWNHLLEGRRAHTLAYDPSLIEFVWDFLTNTSTALELNHSASAVQSSSKLPVRESRGGGVEGETEEFL